MLTKTDFQQIRKIIREEIEEENKNFKREIRMEIKLFRMRLEDRLGRVEDALKDLSIRVRKVENFKS